MSKLELEAEACLCLHSMPCSSVVGLLNEGLAQTLLAKAWVVINISLFVDRLKCSTTLATLQLHHYPGSTFLLVILGCLNIACFWQRLWLRSCCSNELSILLRVFSDRCAARLFCVLTLSVFSFPLRVPFATCSMLTSMLSKTKQIAELGTGQNTQAGLPFHLERLCCCGV